MYKRFNYENGDIMTVYKNTEEGIIAVYENTSISIYTFGWDKLPESDGYQDTTKEVFDKIYNQTMEKIKKSNS